MQNQRLLDRPIALFEVRDASVSDCADRLRALGLPVCSFEVLPPATRISRSLEDHDVRGILDNLAAAFVGYRWESVANDLLNLVPRKSILNTPMPPVHTTAKGAWLVLEDDLRIGAIGLTHFQELGDTAGPKIDLLLKAGDLRDALNGIAAKLGGSAWHVSGQLDQYYLTFTTIADYPSSDKRAS